MKTYTSEYDECLDDVTSVIEKRMNAIKRECAFTRSITRQAKLQHQEEVLRYVLNDIANMRGEDE